MIVRLPKIIFSLLIILIIFQTFGFLFYNLAYNPAAAGPKWTMPDPKITIPGMEKLTAPVCDSSGVCHVNWMGKYIEGIYKYAIGFVGILATVVMMVGGIMWIVAGGNATRIGEARSWIVAALTGLILSLTSYMILYQVNPALTNFDPIKVKIVDAPTQAQSVCVWKKLETGQLCTNVISGWINSDGSKCPAKTSAETDYNACCCPSCPKECPQNLCAIATCMPCENCVTLQILCKDGNQANSLLAAKLLTAMQSSTNKDWQVTEAWPPTVIHQNSCHYIGTCVDVNFLNRSTTPTDVRDLYDNLRNSGLNPVYEHMSDCGPYANAGVNCQVVPAITSPHFSVYL